MASSRIQELPDDFDSSLDLNKGPADASLEETITRFSAETSPSVPSAGPTSIEEVLKEFGKTPLFMDQGDVQNPTVQEDSMLEAMRALQYEGTKLEIAQGFKDQGNEQAKAKMWKDAREFYTKAIAVLLGKIEIPTDPQDEPQTEEEKAEEAKKEVSLLETCYVNRALCQLEIGNYRSTTLDCTAALKINPTNVKAYYRSASALFKVEKLEEADDACTQGLQVDPKNVALKKLQDQIAAKQGTQAKLKAKREEEIQAKKRQQFVLSAALKARNITIKGSDQAPELEDAAIHLEPDPESPQSSLVFPAMFLYPMHAQSDFIKGFGELQTIADHLSYIFPLPWDTEGLYTPSGVECFMDTNSGGMIKVGKKLTLLKLLSNGKTEIVDGLVKIHIVPTKLAPKWIEEMKARKKG